jgi:hypothetical protein
MILERYNRKLQACRRRMWRAMARGDLNRARCHQRQFVKWGFRLLHYGQPILTAEIERMRASSGSA